MPKENEQKKLYRSSGDRMIGGVCGGLAEYFGVDPIIMRLLFVVLLWPALLFYVLAWIFVPEKKQ